MKPSAFLALYEKLEKLVQRLPESLQQAILREITPLKTLFLLQRAPRLVLLGERSCGKAALINAIYGEEILSSDEEMLHDGIWQTLSRAGRGSLDLLDLRRPISIVAAQSAVAASAPDAYLFVRGSRESDGELILDLEHAGRVMEFATQRHPGKARLIGLQMTGDEAARTALHGALHGSPNLETHLIGTLSLEPRSSQIAKLLELMAAELPQEAQLEMARLGGNRRLQNEIAQLLIKSVTAICTAIGAQPIPLADFPILTSLQATMVAAIMHISGREMSVRLGGEFIAAIGANIGAGLVLREGARAAAKLVPVWGNAISGAVAGAGTYAIGRAAVAYFIDGLSLKDARAMLRRKKKKRALLKR